MDEEQAAVGAVDEELGHREVGRLADQLAGEEGAHLAGAGRAAPVQQIH